MRAITSAIATLIALALLGGCISIDPQASRQKPAAGSNGMLRAAYSNDAFYRYRGKEFLGPASVSEALRLHVNADTVYIWRVSHEQLVLRFTRLGALVAERQYKLGEDFTADDDGRLALRIQSECGGRDSPGFGCGWGTAVLFENEAGDLAVITNATGAGLIGVIPFAIHAKHLSLFSRQDQAPAFDSLAASAAPAAAAETPASAVPADSSPRR